MQKLSKTFIIVQLNIPALFSKRKAALKSIKAKVLWAHYEDVDVTLLSDALKVKEKNYPNAKFVITSGLGITRFTGMKKYWHRFLIFCKFRHQLVIHANDNEKCFYNIAFLCTGQFLSKE